MTDESMHPVHLPFAKAEHEQYLPVASAPEGRHVKYFEDSLQRCAVYTESTAAGRPAAPSVTRLARQMQRGERFWIENAFMSPTQRRVVP